MRGKLRTLRIGRSAWLFAAGVIAVLIVSAWPGLAQATGPSVSGITPAAGPAAGGTEVTIEGGGFVSGDKVLFGLSQATITSVSDSGLTAISPPGAGTVAVTVTDPSGTPATGSAQFTYVPAPAVTGISPTTGSPAGGTRVTIAGSGLTTAPAVTFGGVSVPVTVNSNGSLTVVSPAGTGTVDIVVTTAGGTSTTGPPDQFTYTAAPAVTTGSATGVSRTGATLTGSVNADGKKITSCHFQYGTSTRFALSAACKFGSGTPRPVHAKLSALTPGTTYHYRLVATTSLGTTTGAAMTFKTAPKPIIGAPRVGLLLSRVTHSRYIAELLGIQGITGGSVGQSLMLRCVSHCQHPFKTTIPLRQRHDLSRRIGLMRGLLVSRSTRIVIDLVVKGQLSNYASFAFFISKGTIAVKIAKTGCIKGTSIRKCPSPPAATTTTPATPTTTTPVPTTTTPPVPTTTTPPAAG